VDVEAVVDAVVVGEAEVVRRDLRITRTSLGSSAKCTDVKQQRSLII
jgi:hypothetical protein